MDKKVILLVDDEPEILYLYGNKLKREGFDVLMAKDGQEGVNVAREEIPDLILLDLKMPVMNGMEAFVELKNDPATKDIKVVFLTAFSDPTVPEIDQKMAKDIGAMDFIRKGIGLDELVEKIRGFLK
ncbi:MAG: hypothetical protein COU07_01810 [Candidatus Harrisonbacteria bacterium CG10_big_fil_rev_8_21_14_0_10_40_38]|uniref:Response regulatory domain-containing protein n=1 Tax=Candidatus Harrisonbacteria bacterium CG10_big_fil_rev_8_21_14_0_10_40_38 TaxID=1974583 RepID=A0A2H0UT96_9BACT|nr:MAG: hypothetical protein COU07_01810 [Candidatus Harrisonbacteria bacterium CG10_big_fil_rev_8_21_14_0_10_40_38]